MANINFDNNEELQSSPSLQQEEVATQAPSVVEYSQPSSYSSESNIGLSEIEMNDANKINVTIADTEAPLLMLFGPPSCGKTMTLIRLTRYLQKKGYTVAPIPSFRPSYDKNYRELCENFNAMINSSDAAKATSNVSFMLVEVLKEGRRICQILEAPGEYYFNPETPMADFPAYFNKIINMTSRKIWLFFLEPIWREEQDRRNYVKRIEMVKNRSRAHDKAIFVLNKIDKTNYVIAPGRVHRQQALQQVSFLYPNLFIPFRNTNPITSFFHQYNFDFVTMHTGDYVAAVDGTLTFQEGPEEYVAEFWKIIQRHIRG
ncbi:hypothetical protein [Porphyromonas endodontalis]|uniref:hypothetical protein n=1 Tax=Porphyromonas endodontalis TaxID=28124 RepID=UPI0028F0021F|nr:hypothetical protein [Porphyromonas endodontalis]